MKKKRNKIISFSIEKLSIFFEYCWRVPIREETKFREIFGKRGCNYKKNKLFSRVNFVNNEPLRKTKETFVYCNKLKIIFFYPILEIY